MNNINILYDYRPTGNTITLTGASSGDTVIVMMFNETVRGKIVARLNTGGRIELWDKESASAHLSDTEQEFKDKLIAKLST